jgi:hypothetical protein
MTLLNDCFLGGMEARILVVLTLSESPGNTKGGSITVPLTSCLTGFESAL